MNITQAARATISDIAAILVVSKQAVTKRAQRESWIYVEEAHPGRNKRFFPIETLPPEVRKVIQQKAINTALPQIAQEVKTQLIQHAPLEMTDKQRLERDARTGVLAAIGRLQAETSCSKEAAMTTLLTSARAGRLEPVLENMLRLARDARGRAGDGYPSIRTLKRWLTAKDLAPRCRLQDMCVPAWAKDFLSHYQQPQKPSVEDAYRDFCSATPPASRPSIHQVRRFLGKLGTVTRERGRMGSREIKNIMPFVRRDFSLLEPNDIWSADGHTFDAEVQHPFHGRPFRPEITVFVDIATRKAVGWSVDLAESGSAVADALRNGVERHGIPAIIYVDNGSGYRNAFMNDAATGLVGRIGATMTHSLPYNSQARGVIERLHQTLWVQGAKQLPSYIGAEMDREARLQQFKLTRRALKSGGVMPLMPWDIFVKWCEQRITEYNARAHRSLGGTSPDLSWRAYQARGWTPSALTKEEMDTLFRPRVTRTLARAEIRLFNNIYFSRELTEFHGLEAHIAFDIHDPSTIWIYTSEGRFLCEAKVNGNSKHYMPVPVVEQARQKRAKGRLARIEVKREEILEELHGGPAIVAPKATQIVIGGRIIDQETLSSSQPTPETQQPRAAQSKTDERRQRAAEIVQAVPRSERPAAENYAEWQALEARLLAGDQLNESDARWHRTYPQSAQFRAEAKRKAAA